ncbi:MAG: hypothetical protein ACYTGH_07110 [Planctomycetota bacterium]|jgi:metal-dependent amidase/aminoacylase/carboxypeptidase family protein
MDSAALSAFVEEVLPEVKALRRELHQIPELAGEEVKTAERIRAALAETAVELKAPFLKTDVVGMLQGTDGGRNVTLRADMDALPLEE